ncbi:hypothetical protein LTR49_001404 [Elasticomyces elasticus]|nr:hypothetical protein LTR49_001404 [Elasticomyces elasticus]
MPSNPTAQVPSPEVRKTPLRHNSATSSPEIQHGGKPTQSNAEQRDRPSRRQYWAKILDMVCDGMLLSSGGGAVAGRNENESAGVVRVRPKKQ